MEQIRIHNFAPLSLANGPGKRAVIWVQGCTLRCPSCFNIDTHPHSAGGELFTVDEMFNQIIRLNNRIEGITLSGGEPLQQFAATLCLLKKVRELTHLSSVVFSGYTWQEIQDMPLSEELLRCVDVLIAGRYVANLHKPYAMCSSTNQTVHLLSECYTFQDLVQVPHGEIIINSAGEIIISGINPFNNTRGDFKS